MADDEHLRVLRSGAAMWNTWRRGHSQIAPDLSGANLRGIDLRTADLNGAELFEADLSGADLSGADLLGADLSSADLRGANLSDAVLLDANLTNALLSGANFHGVQLGVTIFAGVDLREVQGLEGVHHRQPSEISVSTLDRSEGRIPEIFLRGCGVPDYFIAQIPTLVAAMQPAQFYSCFISYSSKDDELAQRLYADLQSRGVRCWFAPKDLKIGERFRRRIDDEIRIYDRLLLILSKHSVSSSWVEKEVETALESEKEQSRTVLFPVRLDDSVMRVKAGWPADVRRTRHIGDFRRWKEHDEYQKSFARLLADLKASA
jgi:hypothetical protein